MRLALFCAVYVATIPVLVAGEALTVVLDFRGTHSGRSIEIMKSEVETVMKGAGLSFDWRSRSDAVRESFDHLVVVRFNGKCILEPVGYLYDERGPLAFTYSTGGAMQPFSEVSCDQVTASVRSAMFAGDFNRADQLLGRALGRVVAHELVHMLSEDRAHGKNGVAQKSFTGAQLIASELRLNAHDLERVTKRDVSRQREPASLYQRQ
jgi:hypothetical protein